MTSMRDEEKKMTIFVSIAMGILSAIIVWLVVTARQVKEENVKLLAQKQVLEEELLACESKLPVTEAVVDPE